MSRAYAEVIGDPISHSKSPHIHGFWLNALGIHAEYRSFHVKQEMLGAYFLEREADPHWRGCNITIPHKIAALDHVQDREGIRRTIGAINLVVRDESGLLVGANTDVAGFASPLADRDWSGAHVAVVGAGGAARAILFALRRMKVERVIVLNRDRRKAADVLESFGTAGEALPLDASLPPVDLLINASAMGMAGQPPFAPDLAILPRHAIVYDVVYTPLDTPLLLAARGYGLRTIDGLDMLIGQAAEAFTRFFGAQPPRERDGELRALLAR